MIEKALEAKQALEEHGSQNAAAKALGIARSTLQERLKKLAHTGNDGLSFVSVPYGHHVKGVSTYYDQSGMPRGQWIKTRTDAFDPDAFVQYFRDALADYKGTSLPVKPPIAVNSELLTVYPLADLHVGMLAWGKESGEDWDLNIATKTMREAFTNLLYGSRPTQTAILLNLGDWFHTNDAKNMTPRSGNILDVDSRYRKMVMTGVRLQCQMIDLALQRHETVIVRNLPGNHDPESVLALDIGVMMRYENNPRVVFEDNATEFFFYRFGNTLIGANHGHRLKPVDMALKLAVERAEDWGKSIYRHFYFGHIHHETLKEIGGVRVESFQTVAAKDAHTANGGYVSGRSLTAITIHESKGEVGRHRVNL